MDELLVYIGTYTGEKSKGIYLFRMDLATGELTPEGVAAETVNPSFLAIAPGGRSLYAVNEIDDYEGKSAGSVSAFAITHRTGLLSALNRQSSQGTEPCHISLDAAGKHVLVANYGSGSVAVLPIHGDGSLGPATCVQQHEGHGADPGRQEGPHAHSIYVDASNHHALSADLGIDKILVYRYDAGRGVLTAGDPAFASTAPGAGPRHLALHPNGRYVYAVNEMNSTVAAYRYDAHAGTLHELQTLPTLPDDFKGQNTTAEIAIHPSGRFLYASNRGHDSIVIFALDPATGMLSYVGHQPTGGKNPRNFAIDPTGTYLLAANQDSDNIVVFRIEPQTGRLTPTGHVASAPLPVSIVMLPASR